MEGRSSPQIIQENNEILIRKSTLVSPVSRSATFKIIWKGSLQTADKQKYLKVIERSNLVQGDEKISEEQLSRQALEKLHV